MLRDQLEEPNRRQNVMDVNTWLFAKFGSILTDVFSNIANKWFLPVEVFDKGFKPPGLFATEFVKADKSKIATIFILIVLNSPL